MHLGYRAARVLAVIALGTVACGGQKHGIYTVQETTATESSTTSSNPSTSASPATALPTAPVLGPWVVATANLTGLPSECGNMALV